MFRIDKFIETESGRNGSYFLIAIEFLSGIMKKF